jgi:hypothetical protein
MTIKKRGCVYKWLSFTIDLINSTRHIVQKISNTGFSVPGIKKGHYK